MGERGREREKGSDSVRERERERATEERERQCERESESERGREREEEREGERGCVSSHYDQFIQQHGIWIHVEYSSQSASRSLVPLSLPEAGNGLGLRVVGGKEVPGGHGDIGAYVAKVLPGGPAEQTGKILEGEAPHTTVCLWFGLSFELGQVKNGILHINNKAIAFLDLYLLTGLSKYKSRNAMALQW